MPQKICRDCRHRIDEHDFPVDKHGRPDTRHCFDCVDEHTPQLMTEDEAAAYTGMTIENFRLLKMIAVGSYSQPWSKKALPLYGREQLERLANV